MMRHDFLVRLAATGALALLILGPLSLPGVADAGTGHASPPPALHCSTLRSVVNGQVIEMPACRRAD
jgi:hypothetical protein